MRRSRKLFMLFITFTASRSVNVASERLSWCESIRGTRMVPSIRWQRTRTNSCRVDEA